MLNPTYHRQKSRERLLRESHKTCTIPGCNNPITAWEGPGEFMCREHQVLHVDNGGVGRPDRPHTFHRNPDFCCEECGTNVAEEVRIKFPTLEVDDPIMFNRVVRNRLIGDHQIRKADGGTDEKHNIRTLCLNCNADKTMLSKDYKKGKLAVVNNDGKET